MESLDCTSDAVEEGGTEVKEKLTFSSRIIFSRFKRRKRVFFLLYKKKKFGSTNDTKLDKRVLNPLKIKSQIRGDSRVAFLSTRDKKQTGGEDGRNKTGGSDWKEEGKQKNQVILK